MPVQVDSLKEVLQTKQAELAHAIRSHSSQLNLGESENELIDRVQAMRGREEAVAILNRLTRTQLDVQAALLALQNGSYGICVDCDGPITSRRLEAIPWASRCIRCQEDADRRSRARLEADAWDEAA